MCDTCKHGPCVLDRLHLPFSADWDWSSQSGQTFPDWGIVPFPATAPEVSVPWLLPPTTLLDSSTWTSVTAEMGQLILLRLKQLSFSCPASEGLGPLSLAFCVSWEGRLAATAPGTHRPGTGRSTHLLVFSSPAWFLPSYFSTGFSGTVYSYLVLLFSCSCLWWEKALPPAHHIFFVLEQH